MSAIATTRTAAPETSTVEVLTQPFGGGALAQAAVAGEVPTEWYTPVPRTTAEWTAAARMVAHEFTGRAWLDALASALNATGFAAQRLARVAAGHGVVVTTGQQPGLFGGPIYTWSKALTALALADAIERTTGIPAAPVFWAATDDADYAEASYTLVAHHGEAHVLRMADRTESAAMAETPLGDVSSLFAQLAAAAGSAIDPEPLAQVQRSYVPSQTVGGAYVSLLRAMFEPLGMAVLDAAHPAVREAGAPTVRQALARASHVRDALAQRSQAIEDAEYRVQVQPVSHLSLVFHTVNGSRTRIPIKHAESFAKDGDARALGPNVLLRPVMERQILPTVTYVAGPGELAYFAQVSAVANALELSVPRVVPRWSGTILEPHVRDILRDIHATVDDFKDPHAVESRVAREELPAMVRTALAALRETMGAHVMQLRTDTSLPALRKALGGFEVQVGHRIDRLERRYAAAVKGAGNVRLHHVAVARASLYPNGTPQERALNIIPFLARYGTVVRDAMLRHARTHAERLVPSDGASA